MAKHGAAKHQPDGPGDRARAPRALRSVDGGETHAGEASEGQMAYRCATAIAERLGTEPVIFPGGHGGFNKSEWDPSGDPEAFAAKLREVFAAG